MGWGKPPVLEARGAPAQTGSEGVQEWAAPKNHSPGLMETVHAVENPVRPARDGPPAKEGRHQFKSVVCSSFQETETGTARWKGISEHSEWMVASRPLPSPSP